MIKWLDSLEQIFLSVINVEEIYTGLSYKNANKQMTWFEKFLTLKCTVLPLTQQTAKHAGILRGSFRANGITRSQADILIAATAVENNLTVATRNIKDFTNCGIIVYNPFEN